MPGGLTFPRSENTAAYPMSTMTGENMQAYQAAMQGALTGSTAGGGATNPNVENLISTMETQARTNFQNQVLPELQQRMAAAGATDSSAYVREAAGLERQLEENIAAQGANLRYQAWQYSTASGNERLQAALQAAGLPMFQYGVMGGTTGAQAYGNFGQGYAGGYQGAFNLA